MQPLSMPTIVITKKDGTSYTVDHIGMALGGQANSEPVITFICSGVIYILRANEVRSIEYHETGRGYCTSCDNPFNRFIPTIETRDPAPKSS